MRMPRYSLSVLLSAALIVGLMPTRPIIAMAEDAQEQSPIATEGWEDLPSPSEGQGVVEGDAPSNDADEVTEDASVGLGIPETPVDPAQESQSAGEDGATAGEDIPSNTASDQDVASPMEGGDSQDGEGEPENPELLTVEEPINTDPVMYMPGMEPDLAEAEDGDIPLLALMSTQASFETPYQNYIWALRSQPAICYLKRNGSGAYDLRKHDLDNGSVTTLAGSISFDPKMCFVTEDMFYYAIRKYSSSVQDYIITVYCLDLANGSSETLFTAQPSDYYNGYALGVDHSGNVYISAPDSFNVYSHNGTCLYSGEDVPVSSFVGFDASNGNFYFQGTTNWVYWGYDHYMASLNVGNFDGSNVVYNSESITILYQIGFFTHYGCAEMLSDRYLADLSTFNGEMLAILDSHAIDQADVTETETTIDLNGGVSITSVALPAETVQFGAYTFPSDYDNDVDVTSVGARCAYSEGRDLLAVATDERSLACYGLHDCKAKGMVTTAGDIYKVMASDDELLVLERDSSGGLMLERFGVELPTSVTLSGPSNLTIGSSADYSASFDSDVTPPITFASSDPTVLSIDNSGRAATWKSGIVTVTVSTEGGLSDSMTVKVSGGGVDKQSDDVTPLGGAGVDNWNANDYRTYGTTVKSYIAETQAGVMRVQARESDVLIESYDRSGKLQSSKTVTNELPIFGGFFAGSDGYYLAFGQGNSNESDSTTIMRVVRYDKSWKKLGTCDVKGANTYIPFDAGSLRMAQSDGKLYVHTCHEMYQSDDGYHHQANMTFVINESSMTVADSYYDVMNLSYGYVSHSFNQFIASDGSYIYRVDQGDAYPRGIAFTVTPVGNAITRPTTYVTAYSYANDYGWSNYTGVSVGGFEVSDSCALIVFNEDAGGYGGPRNVFVCAQPLDGDGATTTALTSYAEGSKVTALTPHLVKLDDRHFLAIWAERNEDTNAYCTKLALIDQNGNLVSDVVKKTLPLSDCKPIRLSDGSVAWFVSSSSETKLYTLNPYDIASMTDDDFAGKLRANVSGATIGRIADQDYYGTTVKPSVTVTFGSTTLEEDVDYTVSYKNNASVGKATVTITGKGEYTGTKSATFNIRWPFVDVNGKVAHADDICWLAGQRVSEGWTLSNGTREFRPYANVARADMAAFLFRVARMWGLVDDSWQPSGAVSFLDVTTNTAHYREIMWLAESGISRGWDVSGGKEFRPYANVARADMAAFLSRLQALRKGSAPETSGTSPFLDVMESTAHYDDILWLAESGISQGWTVSGGKEFRPYANVARADMAAFLRRVDALQ